MTEVYKARMNKEGRLIIPHACRQRLGLMESQEVLLQISDKGLLLYTQEISVKRLQDWVAARVPPSVSLVDELIAGRRTEAAREVE